MNDRSDFQKEWIDGPALELALVPIEERGEKIVAMFAEIETWIGEEFPDLTREQVLAATRSYSFSIITRTLEISKANSGAIGHA
jgi:hypothetical protein